ncbi:MAG: tetratricopeptide repeat protein [Candidatus Eisenbacteria bacterium]|nr:tetratricopeptide repeat protein [Candidatus Eisenbacteria bacterium]
MSGHDVVDFEKDVIERSRELPVLVDFWAEWCGPCRTLGPVLERLAEDAAGRWALAKVDTEAFGEQATRYGVMSIPNVKLFVNGEVVDEFVGALPEARVREWLARALPSPAAGALAAAREKLAGGDAASAAAELREVLSAEPGNAPARLSLGEALLRLDPAAVEDVIAPLADDIADRAEALRVIAGWLTRADALPEGAARAPFAAALAAVRSGDWDTALARDIEALRADRSWAAGAARELGRAIFLLLGIEHPACEKHYRAFSGAMYV